jgi:hypothetical protein
VNEDVPHLTVTATCSCAQNLFFSCLLYHLLNHTLSSLPTDYTISLKYEQAAKMNAFTPMYDNDIDELAPHEQHRLLLDLPGGDYIAPEVEKRMRRTGETASQALKKMRVHPPKNPNVLPRELYDAPSFVDDDHWEEVREGLRKKGIYMHY